MIYPDKFEEKLNFDRIREMLAGDLAHPRAARIIRDMSDEELVALVDRAESVGIGLLLGEEV